METLEIVEVTRSEAPDRNGSGRPGGVAFRVAGRLYGVTVGGHYGLSYTRHDPDTRVVMYGLNHESSGVTRGRYDAGGNFRSEPADETDLAALALMPGDRARALAAGREEIPPADRTTYHKEQDGD